MLLDFLSRYLKEAIVVEPSILKVIDEARRLVQ